MNLLLRTLLSAIAVVVLANVLGGVYVDNYVTAIIVAVVLAVLNLFVKPLLIILTLPVTVFTLGVFLLFINAFIILLADNLVPGFGVDGVWSAIVFSILLAISESLLFSLFKAEEK